jgi:hypothetical protein
VINYFTNNLLFAYYPRGAGGKFLLNCIGLSDHSVLQARSLVVKQLENNFNQDQKFNWLLEKIEYSKKTKQWNDLGLGCADLFGRFGQPYYPEIDILSNSHLIFSKVAHNFNVLLDSIKTWPNAKILQLENCHNFISAYRPHYLLNSAGPDPDTLSLTWKNIRDQSWPVNHPTTLEEYNQLDLKIRHEDQYVHNHSILQEIITYNQLDYRLLQNINVIKWNCDWFFDCDVCVDQLSTVYQKLCLPDFDQKKIKAYFLAWIDCLDTINKDQEKNLRSDNSQMGR